MTNPRFAEKCLSFFRSRLYFFWVLAAACSLNSASNAVTARSIETRFSDAAGAAISTVGWGRGIGVEPLHEPAASHARAMTFASSQRMHSVFLRLKALAKVPEA